MFRIIRPLNIFILFVTQISFFINVNLPLTNSSNHKYSISSFLLLLFSSCLISAAGYIVNDILDFKIDLINKPNKTKVGRKLSFSSAWILYYLLNIIAITLGFFIADTIIFILLLASIILLYFYSVSFKKIALLGNICIAVLTALSVLLVMLLDLDIMDKSSEKLYFTFILFAFLSTLIREIVKDIEDLEGDKKYNLKTIAVILESPYLKVILYFINLLLTASLLILYFDNQLNIVELIHWLILLFIPLFLFNYMIFKSKTKNDYTAFSYFLKMYMIYGISFLWLQSFFNFLI